MFATREYTGGGYLAAEMAIDRLPRRVVLLWMLDHAPVDHWNFFRDEALLVDGSALGRPECVSAYVALPLGTNDYLDGLVSGAGCLGSVRETAAGWATDYLQHNR